MNDIVIRSALPKDMEQLLAFEQGVIEAERPFDPTLKKESIHYYNIEEMMKASHIELVVAEWKDKIIASGYARIENAKPYLNHSKHAYLGFMYVDKAHRGKGINQKIIDTLKTWANTQQVKELRLDVYYNNSAAINAYEKTGFSKHMIEMRLNLDE